MRTETELIDEGLRCAIFPPKWAEFIMGLETEELIIVGRQDWAKLLTKPVKEELPEAYKQTTSLTCEVVEVCGDGTVLVKLT